MRHVRVRNPLLILGQNALINVAVDTERPAGDTAQISERISLYPRSWCEHWVYGEDVAEIGRW